jgi:hypothetical protein
VNKRVLLRIAVSVAIGFPISAFAQAAAESALTNALSSSSTVKGGTALNHALNQSSKQLGVRIQERTSSPVQVGVQQERRRLELKNPAAARKSGGNVYAGSTPVMGAISIQGGEAVCASVSPNSQASPAKTGAGTASIDCRSQRPTSKSRTEDKYKSFVTLPLPK